MAGYERTLEDTPTWAVAVVVFVIVFVSILMEHGLHLLGHFTVAILSATIAFNSYHHMWLTKRNKRALYEAVEKIKAELMLLGFISLVLTVLQGPISDICLSKEVGDTWHPCDRASTGKETGKCADRGLVPFVSFYGIHQLHIFIFVLALFHVLYCICTWFLGTIKMKRWQQWEDETKTLEYQYSHDPERFRFARDTSFGRRHLSFWSKSPILLWTVCFFRQFYKSVDKVDYLTLRHGFITAHLAPSNETHFDFQKYIKKSLEEDFKVVVGITPVIWMCAVLYLLSNTHGWYSYLWLPFISLFVILLVGTKLQMIIAKMGLRIQEQGDVVKGAPVVQPGDDLFWFGRPDLVLFLINFVLFQNAFQLAFFAWSWKVEDIVIRVTMGVLIQFLSGYVTLPLYALVTQMGSIMKPAIFNDRVANALKDWHRTAKKVTRQGKSGSNTPLTSRPGTPTHGTSPTHLLHNFRQADSSHTSRTTSAFETDHWDADDSHSPRHQDGADHRFHNRQFVSPGEQDGRQGQMLGQLEMGGTSTQLPVPPRPIRTQHEVNVSGKDFSFVKRG